MKQKILINWYCIQILFLLLAKGLNAQNIWTIYNTSNSGIHDNYISDIAIDANNNKWCCSYYHGVVKFDDNIWSIYDTTNHKIPYNDVSHIACDTGNNQWISCTYPLFKSTIRGLCKFNDLSWTSYDYQTCYSRKIAIDNNHVKWYGCGLWGGVSSYNDSLFSNYSVPNYTGVNSIAFEGNYKWFVLQKYVDIYLKGAAIGRFDGVNWNIYPSTIMGLSTFHINDITVDNSGNKWVATNEGILKYNNSTWVKYNTSNSILPSNKVFCITHDLDGNIWAGTDTAIVKYNGSTWTIFNSSNCPITGNRIIKIAIDNFGNKWFSIKDCGIAKLATPTSIVVNQINLNNVINVYPNPTNSQLVIDFSSIIGDTFKMQILDITGRKIIEKLFFNNEKFDLSTDNFSDGIYFCSIKTKEKLYQTKFIILKK